MPKQTRANKHPCASIPCGNPYEAKLDRHLLRLVVKKSIERWGVGEVLIYVAEAACRVGKKSELVQWFKDFIEIRG